MNQVSNLFSFFLLFCFTSAFSQTNFWRPIDTQAMLSLRNDSELPLPQKYRTLELDFEAMKQALHRLAADDAPDARLPLRLPLPDGSFEVFSLHYSPNFPAKLQDKYPAIRSFAGFSENGSYLRLSLSPLGFHAVITGSQGEVYIDPFLPGDHRIYMAYFTKDLPLSAEWRAKIVHDHSKHQTPAPNIFDQPQGGRNSPFKKMRSRQEFVELLEYDIAIACTGEFAQFYGGTVPQAMAGINLALDRINAIFITEHAIRLNLVANNDTLVFLNGATDPYTNGDPGEMVDENPGVLNSRIGFGNYDIGHVFGTATGGGTVGTSGGVGIVCGNFKARGASSLLNFYNAFIGVVAHELGHQFGALHTWNNCPGSNDDPNNYNPSSAFEPGSGSTIMSYAGACANQDIQNNADLYFHVNSLELIRDFARTSGGLQCAEVSPTPNRPPTVEIPLPNGFSIPVSTPFKLTARATDPDGDALTYCWEQYDKDFYISNLGNPLGNDPLFRSFAPTTDSSRYFPALKTVVRNQSDRTEDLPDYSRRMTFRCTVRDNNEAGGGVAWKEVVFSTTDQAGPFRVLDFDGAGLRLPAGGETTIRWDVAGSDAPPVNCRLVNIRFSIDGGSTFPYLLAANTPNDGEAAVSIPDTLTLRGRIMVEAADNIFYDLNNADLTVQANPDTTFSLQVNPAGIPLSCQPTTEAFAILAKGINGFNQPIQLDLIGDLPPGLQFGFSEPTILPGQTSQLNLQTSQTVRDTIQLTLRAVAPNGDTLYRELYLRTVSTEFPGFQTTSPENGAGGIQLSAIFSWQKQANADTYQWELATSPAFGTSIFEAGQGIRDTFYRPFFFLDENELYFWRVRPVNECGPGPFTGIQTLHTAATVCRQYQSPDVPKAISGIGTPTVESTIVVDQEGTINDVNIPLIRANYQPVNSLRVSLVSPQGTEVVLFDQNCGNTINLNLGFDDQAPQAIVCPPDDGIVFRPVGKLSDFAGENIKGTWTLRVQVIRSGFGASGGIDEWRLEFCTQNNPINPEIVNNDTLLVPPGLTNTITPNELLVSDQDNTATYLVYTLVRTPAAGDLRLWGTALEVGDQFTQSQLNALALTYTHTAPDTPTDDFQFVVEDGTGGFLPVTSFQIKTDPNAVVGTDQMVWEQALSLAPNPAGDQLFIQTNPQIIPAGVTFDLINLQGKVLRADVPLENTSQRLNLNGLPGGIYFLRFRNADGIAVKRFVKR